LCVKQFIATSKQHDAKEEKEDEVDRAEETKRKKER